MPTRLRASDRERDHAVGALREHLAEGRLDVDEFVARMERAQSAVYVDELDPLFADLPPRPEQPAGVPARRSASRRPLRPPPRPSAMAWLAVPFALVALVAVVALVAAHIFPFWIPLVALWLFASSRRGASCGGGRPSRS